MSNGFGQQYGRALTTARRRARLSGRSLTSQETAGMTRGLAESASGRLTRAKGLELQERGLAQQATQFGVSMEETRAARGQRQTQFASTLEESGLNRAERARLQAERLRQQREQTTAMQTWQGEQREAAQTWQAGESVLGRAHETTEAELARTENIRQFDILYGPPSEAEDRIGQLERELARLKRRQPAGATRPQYYGGSAGSER